MYILGCCFIAVMYTTWQAVLKFWSKEILRRLKAQRVDFVNMIKKYKHVKMLDADIWDVPSNDYSVINSVIGNNHSLNCHSVFLFCRTHSSIWSC